MSAGPGSLCGAPRGQIKTTGPGSCTAASFRDPGIRAGPGCTCAALRGMEDCAGPGLARSALRGIKKGAGCLLILREGGQGRPHGLPEAVEVRRAHPAAQLGQHDIDRPGRQLLAGLRAPVALDVTLQLHERGELAAVQPDAAALQLPAALAQRELRDPLDIVGCPHVVLHVVRQRRPAGHLMSLRQHVLPDPGQRVSRLDQLVDLLLQRAGAGPADSPPGLSEDLLGIVRDGACDLSCHQASMP